MSVLKKIALFVCGLLVAGTAGAVPEATQIEPPPLDGKRAPSNPLIPWLAKDGVYGYAGRDGVVKIAPRFAEARLFYEGFAAVQENARWGFIQPSGEFQILAKYNDVTDFQDGQAVGANYSHGVNDPIWGKPLISGSIEKQIIDRRGSVLKTETTRGVLAPQTLGDRMFRRYHTRPPAQVPDWERVLLPDGKWLVRREGGGRAYRFDDLVTLVRDALSEATTFIAVREGKTWKVLNMEGKTIASALENVYETASEGCFVATPGSANHQYAAFDGSGRRLTPPFAQHGFIFYDGVAEAQVPLWSKAVFVDRTGRIYAYPEFIKELDERLFKANGGK